MSPRPDESPLNALENRIPPPIVATIFGIGMWALAVYVPGVDVPLDRRLIVALVLTILGTGICLAGFVSFKRAKTTVNPLKPDTASALVIVGVYNYSRNPMYVGFALLLVAWTIYLASPAALVGVIGFVLYINRFQIVPEERALAALFGDAFTAYKARVRRWL